MNFQGITIGIIAFAIIGIFHPIVIKTEYYLGKKVWPVFLVAGVSLIGLSLFINSSMTSAIAGVVGFSSLWSIHVRILTFLTSPRFLVIFTILYILR
ncbi:DUF4491 family protein [Clostridium sp. CF012]|nr:DUF4491 family protein [Clostridium sp. CF012]